MRARIVALPLVVAVLVGGCGDDDSLDLESLADDSADVTVPPTDAGSPDSSDSGDPDSSDVASDDGGEPSDTTAPKPPVDPEAKQGGEALAAFFDSGTSSETEQCMVDGLLADPELLEAILAVGPAGELSELPEDDQVAAVQLGLSCVTSEELGSWIQAGLGEDGDEPLPADAVDCVSNRLTDESNSDRTALMLGLVAVGEGRAPSAAQVDVIVAMMVDCVDSSLLVESALESIVDDPALEAAVDRSCLDDAFGDASYLDRFYRLLIENPDVEFEQLAPDQQLQIVEPMFGCISFGTVIAASAAESGVELSGDTIACIDDAIDAATLTDMFLFGGDLDESEFVATVLPCLSPEELGALG